MADDFTLSPEDRLLWQRRAPRASFWFRVSDTHPSINGGQPIPGLGVTPPPPPYSPPRLPAPPTPQPYLGSGQHTYGLGAAPPLPHYLPPYPPTLPTPTLQPYLGNGQPITGMPGVAHPGFTVPFPPVNMVPIYDVHHQNNAVPVTPEDAPPSLPSRKLKFSSIHNVSANDILVGFTVSVPLKQHRSHDTQSRAEIAFEWDTLVGDFYDRVCARMDLDPKDAMLGYKFEVDPKRLIIRLPPNDLVAFNTMLDKVKSRISRARTRSVVLEIHDLVCLGDFVWTNIIY